MQNTIGILDIETGGFSISKNGVCEIAILVVDEKLEEVTRYCELIKPYTRSDDSDEMVSYNDESMLVNGITIEELHEKGLYVLDVCNQILALIEEYNIKMIVGHCVKSFDIPRLNYLLERFTNQNINRLKTLCTHEHAREILKGEPSYKLDDLCRVLGIKSKQLHRALSDSFDCLELLKVLREKGLNINKI